MRFLRERVTSRRIEILRSSLKKFQDLIGWVAQDKYTKDFEGELPEK